MCCPSAEALSNHLDTEHLGSGKGTYTCHWENCTRCQKPFTQRQKAIRHIRTHTGLKAYKVPPPPQPRFPPVPHAYPVFSATSAPKPSPPKKSYTNTPACIPTPVPTPARSVPRHSPRPRRCWCIRGCTRGKSRCSARSVGNGLGRAVICGNMRRCICGRGSLGVRSRGVGDGF